MPIGETPSLPPEIRVLATSSEPSAYVAPQRPRIVSGKITLEADRVTHDVDGQITHLTGNVVATYEQTRLTADEAEIDTLKKEASFRKGVKLIDEVGTLEADEIYVNYLDKVHGYARGIRLKAYEAIFEGEELTFGDNTFRLKNAWFTTCLGHYRILLKDVVIKPGRYVSARNSTLELGRGFRLPIPLFRVGLNRNETGIQSPVPSVEEDFKFGYRWENTLVFGDRTSFVYNQRGGQSRIPSINTTLSYNLSARDVGDIVVPRNEERERFRDGYLDNVIVVDPKQEDEDIGQERTLAFVGHASNIRTRARPGDPEALDRPIFAGFEMARSLGPIKAEAQVRYGLVKERLTSQAINRMEGSATALLPDVSLGKKLALRFRADLGLFAGDQGYGWLRPLAALVFSPNEQMRLSAGYFSAATWGTPQFDNDRLYSTQAAHLRADFDFASTDLSLLLKYDFDRRRWYDFEVSFGQVMHCIRPFFSYRSFPGTIALGFTLRADKLFEALRRREIMRENLPPP
ncbi:MAG: LPS-assembly protein LptD [Armatimonadetes bacterium]|nr:LPS-assembly protein LptD [Armatimonadota bacterium]